MFQQIALVCFAIASVAYLTVIEYVNGTIKPFLINDVYPYHFRIRRFFFYKRIFSLGYVMDSWSAYNLQYVHLCILYQNISQKNTQIPQKNMTDKSFLFICFYWNLHTVQQIFCVPSFCVIKPTKKKVHKIVATHSCIRSVSIHAIIPTLTVQQTQLRIPFWLAFCRMRGSLSFICGSLIISVSPYFHSTPTQY